MKTPVHRGPRARTRPDGPPDCPGCDGPLRFDQPDEDEPGELLGSCSNPACREWSVWSARDGRFLVTGRIPAAQRGPRQLDWRPARPATSATATR